jgi:SRSO17 transposase
MDAARIEEIGPILEEYLAEFRDCMGRPEPAAHLETYVRGQLSGLPRKSVEPIADAAGTPPRTLQNFLSRHGWDDAGLTDRLHRIVARDHTAAGSVGIIDETSFAKKGDKTPGVKRQHCGSAGKVDNCTVTVHLGYALPDGFRCLLGADLFLPADWADDAERCGDAGIPEGTVHRTKPEIALELHAAAVAAGVRLDWLTGDEGYGRPTAFHRELSRRGQRYVLEVPRNFAGWVRRPEVMYREHRPRTGPGRRPVMPRLKRRNPPVSTVENLFLYSPVFRTREWIRFHVKDTEKGPSVWEVKAAALHFKDEHGLPTDAHWLLAARNSVKPDELKFFVSNAPPGTPTEALLRVAFARWNIERCFEDGKTELGLDHFEVRNHRSLMRHLAITALSLLFLSRVRREWG